MPTGIPRPASRASSAADHFHGWQAILAARSRLARSNFRRTFEGSRRAELFARCLSLACVCVPVRLCRMDFQLCFNFATALCSSPLESSNSLKTRKGRGSDQTSRYDPRAARGCRLAGLETRSTRRAILYSPINHLPPPSRGAN